MSLYIPGMEMPTSCYKCPVNKDDGFGYFTCGVTHSECDFRDLPADCPLVPVPEHGRLIDADALAKTLGITDMDCYKCAWGNHGFCGRGGDFSDACEAIEEATTIIPASEEGE